MGEIFVDALRSQRGFIVNPRRRSRATVDEDLNKIGAACLVANFGA